MDHQEHQKPLARGPIQVTLEDNVRTQFKPQVQILRRPKPANQVADDINTMPNHDSSNLITANSAIRDANHATSTTYSNILSRNNNNASSNTDIIRTHTMMTTTAIGPDNGSSSSSSNNTGNRTVISNGGNHKTMRTYQERADEYAKARLRILGSAFPLDADAEVNNITNNNV